MRVLWKHLFAGHNGRALRSNPHSRWKTGRLTILPSETGYYILAFALVLVAIVSIFWVHIADMYREEMAHWRARQSTVAEDRARLVSDWLAERSREVGQVSLMAGVLGLLGQQLQPRWFRSDSEVTQSDRAALDEIILPHGCLGLYVVNPDGNEIAHTSTSSSLIPKFGDASRAVVSAGAARIVVFDEIQGSHLIAFITPVWSVAPERNGPREKQILGTVIEVLDLSETLFPVLMSEAVPTRTSETRLVRREGNEVILFSPSRFRRLDWRVSRDPVAETPPSSLDALEGRDTFAEYTDYRNEPVLAATRRIPLTGWGLIRKTDRAEALETFRRMAMMDGLVAGLVLVLLSGGLFTLHRQRLLTCWLEKEGETVRQLNEELEERVKRRTAELQAANQELEAFSYSVSHDLRAPLRAINGFSGILETKCGDQLSDEAQKYMKFIRQGAVHMGQLIDDLLTLSRVGRQELRRKPVEVADVARASIEDLQADWKERPVEFVFGELPPCEADPGLLRQVFVNLLSNAIKFTRKRKQPRIEIGALKFAELRPLRDDEFNRPSAATPGPDCCVYYVRDNGAGFDMHYAEKLFGVFQRLHRQDEFEGTGVGLAIVQRIVRKHGGQVWGEAEVEKGATFYFTIGSSLAETRTESTSIMTAKDMSTSEQASECHEQLRCDFPPEFRGTFGAAGEKK